MVRLHSIAFKRQKFYARSGQVLLDAALMSGLELPYDCRAGRCGTCMVRILSGISLGGEVRQAADVLACQAMVFSDLEIDVEPRPPPVAAKGRILALRRLARGTLELTIAAKPVPEMLPGQYCRFKFDRFPARAFSPTASFSDIALDGNIRLNIKRVASGRVTAQLGRAIKAGHRVRIDGPYGDAFLRYGKTNRLILIGSGTGFAPVWAIAAAALRENAARRIVLIAAARNRGDFYMQPALNIANIFPFTTALGCIGDLGRRIDHLIPGSPLDQIPDDLSSGDCVYAAGAPTLVAAVARVAAAARATFYSDPFEPENASGDGYWQSRARAWFAAR